jgi:thioredoxin-like negative regulator of GroEL
MKAINILLLIAIMSIGAQSLIHHLNDKNFESKVNEAPVTLVYIYSSSCKFCKEFTPIFEKLSKNAELLKLNYSFGKIDGPLFKDTVQAFEAYSYPTIAVFFKGIYLPILYRKAREEKPLVEFLTNILKSFENQALLSDINKMKP